MKGLEQYKLCYTEDGYAYFTKQPLDKQWGDDWNDVPYEHNAGLPYNDADCILKVGFDDVFEYPYSNHFNSPYSVEMINNGVVPWLSSPDYEKKRIDIYAGTTLIDFIETLKSVNCDVYLPYNNGKLLINTINQKK